MAAEGHTIGLIVDLEIQFYPAETTLGFFKTYLTSKRFSDSVFDYFAK